MEREREREEREREERMQRISTTFDEEQMQQASELRTQKSQGLVIEFDSKRV